MSVVQKVALITGTNSGIGRALALEFSNRNTKVYATDRVFSQETLDLFNSKGINTQIVDVTSVSDIKAIRERIQEENDGKLNYLYGNAGMVRVVHATDITDQDFKDIYDLNVLANIRLVREFVRLLINARGTIAFSGSVTKQFPLHANSLYSSSKAALDRYAYGLHSELKNYDVRVHNIVGGYIQTDIFKSGVNSVPEDSIYNFEEYTESFKDRSSKLTKGSETAMSPEVFAKRTLDQIENASKDTFRIYEGSKSSRLYWGATFMSAKQLTNTFLNLFNLNFDYRKHLKDDKIDLPKL